MKLALRKTPHQEFRVDEDPKIKTTTAEPPAVVEQKRGRINRRPINLLALAAKQTAMHR
ncbi:hypothetical protein ACW0JT_16615 [Arthrobacter sp. SA17]